MDRNGKIISVSVVYKEEKMRITDLWDLKRNNKKRKQIKESLIQDIESLAELKFKSEFKRFAIKIKLVPINKYY